MKTVSAILTKEDINDVFTALVEHSPEIGDSPVTDLFCTLAKLNSDVLFTTIDDVDRMDIPEQVRDLIRKIGEVLDEDDQYDMVWSVDDADSDSTWSINDVFDGWKV
jgi:hypothetical protein